MGQDAVTHIQTQIDSLKNVRKSLTKQLQRVEEDIAEMEARLIEHTVIEQIDARGVVTTNMDASLRDAPMPGANIIRTIPPD